MIDLNHGEVLAVFGVKLVVAALDDGELTDVVVDRLLAGRCPLQQSKTNFSHFCINFDCRLNLVLFSMSPDGVVRSVDIIEGCMRLPSAGNYVLHQVHSGHRWGERRCEDHAFCPIPKSQFGGYMRRSKSHSNQSVLALFCQGKQPGVMGPGLALAREGIKGSSCRIQSASQF